MYRLAERCLIIVTDRVRSGRCIQFARVSSAKVLRHAGSVFGTSFLLA
jgi:hypothetical protein